MFIKLMSIWANLDLDTPVYSWNFSSDAEVGPLILKYFSTSFFMGDIFRSLSSCSTLGMFDFLDGETIVAPIVKEFEVVSIVSNFLLFFSIFSASLK